MMLMRYFAIFLCLFVSGCSAEDSNCDLSDPDCKFPDNYAYGIVNSYYENGDSTFSEEIIRAHGGFGDNKFFPISMNILINQALKSNDGSKYDLAMQYLQSFNDKEFGTEEGSYIEIVEFLKNHSGLYVFEDNKISNCSELILNLEDVHNSASQIFTKAYFEYAVWYSLYVNSKCATPATRAIYIANLSQIDLDKAIVELNRMQTELSSINEVDLALLRGRICRIGKDNELDTRDNGVYALHQDGYLKCNQWSN